jgi:Helix-turn-helix domain
MLSVELVHKINSLLREGELSQRQIAARLGVSRSTIAAIASGQRGLYGRGERDQMSRARGGRRRPRRCGRCGHRVYMPCLVCIARDFRGQKLSGGEPINNQIKRRKRSPRTVSQGD